MFNYHFLANRNVLGWYISTPPNAVYISIGSHMYVRVSIENIFFIITFIDFLCHVLGNVEIRIRGKIFNKKTNVIGK